MRYDDVILRWAKIATVLFTAMAVVADVFGVVITKYIAYCWAGVFDLPSVIGLTTVFYIGTVGGYLIHIVYELFKESLIIIAIYLEKINI